MEAQMNKAILAVAFMALWMAPAPAAAHVTISPAEAPAGRTTGFSFTVGHGCAGAATTGLTVEVPKEVGGHEIEQLKGWKTSTPSGSMVWRGGPLADGELLGFPFRAKVFGKKGDQVPFKVIQTCEGGGEIAWISVGEQGGSGHGSPAPVVTLATTAVKPGPPPQTTADGAAAGSADPQDVDAETVSSQGEDGDGSGIGAFALVALAAAFLTTLVVILRARRNAG
jgi:periplasmic copper chaperone A